MRWRQPEQHGKQLEPRVPLALIRVLARRDDRAQLLHS